MFLIIYTSCFTTLEHTLRTRVAWRDAYGARYQAFWMSTFGLVCEGKGVQVCVSGQISVFHV